MLPEEQRGWFTSIRSMHEGKVFIGASYGRRYWSNLHLSTHDPSFHKHSLIRCSEPLDREDSAKFKRVAPGTLVEWND